MKFHTSLPVLSIADTKEFYAILFDAEPVKEKADYLKFLPEQAGLNITFIQSSHVHKNMHLGFEARDASELNEIYVRLEKAGLLKSSDKAREDSTCCYARQDKFWVKDPSGYEWEIYTVLQDTTEFSSPNTSCCVTKDASSACGG